MALVRWDHAGNIVADENWTLEWNSTGPGNPGDTYEHHITAACPFSGGTLGNPITVTIEAGATVYYDGNFGIFYCLDVVNDYYFVYIPGIESNKVLMDADPTTYPTAGISTYVGMWMYGAGQYYDVNWVHIKHAWALARMHVPGVPAGGPSTFKNCCVEYCNAVVGNTSTAGDLSADGIYEFDGIYVKNCNKVIDFISGNVNNVGVNWYKNISAHGCTRRGYTITLIDNQQYAAWRYYFDGLIITTHGAGNIWFEGDYAVENFWGITLKRFFPRHTSLNYDQVPNSSTIFIAQHNFRDAFSFEDSIFYNLAGCPICAYTRTGALEDLTVQYCDFINNADVGVWYKSTGFVTVVLDHLYHENNYMVELIGTGNDPNPTHLQWWDSDNAQGPTNTETTPNFELDVESVSEGTPDSESITITYDSKLGNSGKRLEGVPFIKYGVDSGGPYPHSAGVHPQGETEICEVFAKWRTDLGGLFKTTGHSVTLSNLKPGTTYYYQPCFIDPLSRIAEGEERSFVTSDLPIMETDIPGGSSGPVKVDETIKPNILVRNVELKNNMGDIYEKLLKVKSLKIT